MPPGPPGAPLTPGMSSLATLNHTGSLWVIFEPFGVSKWGYFTLSMGHLPNTFCFISPSSCFISPSNLLHFPNKSLRFPNSLLHFPNRSLHFPNTVSHFPNTILCHFAKHRIKVFFCDLFSFLPFLAFPRQLYW